MYTCSHTHPALHNKWFHFNCYSCLFTSACNGWSFFFFFFTEQPITVRQKKCELPSKSGTITCNLTFLFIRSIHQPRMRQLITINCNLSVLGSLCIYLCICLSLSWSSFTMPPWWLMIMSSVIGGYFRACLLSQWGAPSVPDIHHCFTALRKEVSCYWLLCGLSNRHIPIGVFSFY